MGKNLFELDPERLATTDESGNRIFLHPEDVSGKWKNRRKLFYWFLIGLYLVLPWFNINGRPALQVDIFHREFTFLGFTLHGVEPILFFLLVASGIFFIGFVTSLFGRVWCGWGCPQTVFIQSIFIKIEAFFEGKARARRELDLSPMSLNKFLRRSGKWAVYVLVSLHIANTFLGYFVGPREVFRMTVHSPTENWGMFIAVMILTTIFTLDFGWFREQFCIIACPYGKMQSVMMDENSLVVAYNTQRGEPRRGSSENHGDCVNCYKCVMVCPTGIDIRRGTQLECIACTQCIDACDEVMEKIHKPKGLIRYASENQLLGKSRRAITFRSGFYVTVCVTFMVLFGYFLNASTHLNLVFLRSKVPYQLISGEGRLLNHFTLKIKHQGERNYLVHFVVSDPKLSDKIEIITNQHPVPVNVPEKKTVIFFKFDPGLLTDGTRKIMVKAVSAETQEILATREVTLVGPAH